MPDGWSWKVGDPHYDLRALAERLNPGCKYIDAEPMITGLWRDVILLTDDDTFVTRRIYF